MYDCTLLEFFLFFCTLLTYLLYFIGMVTLLESSSPGVPAYGLYGEPLHSSPLALHIESIAFRTRAFNGEIDVHLHHNLHQLVWLASGQMTVRINGDARKLTGPAAVVIPALVVHAFVAEPDAEGFVLTASTAFFRCESKVADDALKSLYAAPTIFSLGQAADRASDIDALCGVLANEFDTRRSNADLLLKPLAEAICLLIGRHEGETLCSDAAGLADKDIARFLALVDRYYAADLFLAGYAEYLGCSTDRLIRLVRKVLGKSPMQIVHERRLKEACHRLLTSKASVSEISTAIGFSDVAYFCRFFKQHVGLTPSQFKAQHP